MIRTLASLGLAALIALSHAAPVSAQAHNEQLQKILLGAATLGVAAIAIDKIKDRKDEKEADTRNASNLRPAEWDRRNGPSAREKWGRHVVPAACIEHVMRTRGLRRVVSKRCLQQTVHRFGHAPRQCETQVYAFGRNQDVYRLRCLEDFGWTVAQHR